MNVHLANYDPKRVGGGWTWANYFVKHFGQTPYQNADIYLIASASTVQRSDVSQAQKDGKKIVLRVDNAIRNSRNRNTGMTRLKDFSKWADLVIYQSEWAKKFLMPFTQRDGTVILNGVDTNIYNDKNRTAPDNSYLYARSSRDEGKQWIMAWYWFVNNPGTLEIVGKFSGENMEYNFDFYNDERYRFLGEQPNLIHSFKRNKYFLYTYLNDAMSNTAIEALASGCEIIDVYGMAKTGGMPEIMADWNKDPNLLNIETCMHNYRKAIESIL